MALTAGILKTDNSSNIWNWKSVSNQVFVVYLDSYRCDLRTTYNEQR